MWCTVGGQQWHRQLHADTASCNVMWCTVGGQQWLRQLHADTASWEETATWSTRFNEWRDWTKPTADKSFVRHRDWGEFTLLHMSSSWLCDIHLLTWISLRLWFFCRVCVTCVKISYVGLICKISSVRPMFSLYWFYILTLYFRLGLRADIDVVYPPVCPACCTMKFTLNIVNLTVWHVNK